MHDKNKKIIGLDKQYFQRKIVNIVLRIIFKICFGCSKEPSHQDGSFEYQQQMFWLRKKKIIFSVTHSEHELCIHTVPQTSTNINHLKC